MKYTKKLLALVLAVMLVLSLATTASADTGNSITLTGETGHTYEAYQIFTGDYSDGVLSNIVWGTGVSTAGQTALGSAATKAESLTNEADAKAFAAALDQYLTGAVELTESTTAGTYTLTNLTAGYYLVKDKDDTQESNNGTYTAYILQVVGEAKIEPKDSVPTVDKDIKSGSSYVEATDVNIGDSVTFVLTATLGDNIDEFTKYKLVFHDTLSAGLTYSSYSSATLDGTDVKASFTKGGSGTTLTFTCDDVIALGAKDGSVIVITYTAKLNSNAEIGKPGNSNKVYLEYSNDPSTSGTGTPGTGNTPEDEVLVFTYELDVTKVDGAATGTKLSGAEFILYKGSGTSTEYAKVGTNGKLTGWATTEADATTLTSDENGLFKVIGLDAGTYYLKETKAPAGYNLLADPVTVVITATLNTTEEDPGLTALKIKVGTGSTANGDLATGIVSGQVTNNRGATLPSTGGIGTTIFYTLGGILVMAAVVLLVTKKRMSTAE